MEKKPKRSPRGHRKRWTLISVSAITLIAVLITVSYLNTRQAQIQESNKYFAFSEFGAVRDATAFGGSNTTIKIIELVFNFTPVGGDANEVTIFSEGGVAPTDYFWLHIPNGTSTFVDIQYEHGITSRKQANGYPVTFRLFSHEPDGDIIDGDITLVIPEEDVFSR